MVCISALVLILKIFGDIWSLLVRMILLYLLRKESDVINGMTLSNWSIAKSNSAETKFIRT